MGGSIRAVSDRQSAGVPNSSSMADNDFPYNHSLCFLTNHSLCFLLTTKVNV